MQMNRKTILMMTVTIVTVMLVATGVINAQDVKVKPDTATVRAQEREQQVQKQNQNREQAQNQGQEQNQTQAEKQNQGQSQSQNQDQMQNQGHDQAMPTTGAKVQNQGTNATGVKKVQSARPDWSKARGARPPSVERPSGSRIPKGAGKPGGAKGPGKR
jgi:hypothetical protein